MTLTSLPFYLLVLALLVLYYLVPKRFQWVVLLIGSFTRSCACATWALSS